MATNSKIEAYFANTTKKFNPKFQQLAPMLDNNKVHTEVALTVAHSISHIVTVDYRVPSRNAQTTRFAWPVDGARIRVARIR